jgi:hypothetical protein
MQISWSLFETIAAVIILFSFFYILLLLAVFTIIVTYYVYLKQNTIKKDIGNGSNTSFPKNTQRLVNPPPPPPRGGGGTIYYHQKKIVSLEQGRPRFSCFVKQHTNINNYNIIFNYFI